MSRIDRSGSYPLTLWDDEVPEDIKHEVWEYLMDSEYCVNFYDQAHSNYYPRTKTYHIPRTHPAAVRLPLAWSEESLETRSPIIYKLWKHLEELTNFEFTINGAKEGMPGYFLGVSPLPSYDRSDGTPGKPNCAWLVFGDGQEHELKAHTKAIHTDALDINDDTHYTLVYFAHLEWFPQYYGETIFHSPISQGGDYTGKFEKDQSREFPIGEAENVVGVRPGRVMLFDSRYLHQIKSVATYCPDNLHGVVFRVRRDGKNAPKSKKSSKIEVDKE